MKNKEILYGVSGLIIGILLTLVFTGSRTNHGMMSGNNIMGSMNTTNTSPSTQKVVQIKLEEVEGQKLLQSIKSNSKTCKDLSQDNFEKIGDYVMRQRVGSSEKHAVMDANMEQMMGKDQNVQMHIALGKNATGCSSPVNAASNSGTMQMMNH